MRVKGAYASPTAISPLTRTLTLPMALKTSVGAVKGSHGSRMRSAAEGEHRTGEYEGEAVPLIAPKRPTLGGRGHEVGRSPPAMHPCHVANVGKARRSRARGNAPLGLLNQVSEAKLMERSDKKGSQTECDRGEVP